MAMPGNIGVIDLMMNIPGEDQSAWYEFMKPMLMDEESRQMFTMPVQYMFKDIPDNAQSDDYIAYTIAQMDTHGIERAMLNINDDRSSTAEALKRYPERFFAS